jgi:hypothetical protein
MLDTGDNVYQCEIGDHNVKVRFAPTKPDELKIVYMRSTDEHPSTLVGNQWTDEMGDEPIILNVFYIFVPGSTSRCRIYVSGDIGPEYQDKPPARDLPVVPEHRIYTFLPR